MTGDDSAEALLAMQRYYAQRAPVYDAVYAIEDRQADLRWLEQYLPRCFSGARVLELAAGTGYWTQFLVREAASVLAVDASAETLAELDKRELGERVQTKEMDVYALAELGGGFDAVFAGFWFSHVPLARRRTILRAIDAVLAPGARVVMVDNLHTRAETTHIDAEGDAWQTRELPDGGVHPVLKHFPQPDELIAAIDGLGSAPVWRELEHYWVFEYTTGHCRQ